MNINISEAEWEVMRVVWSNDVVTSKLVMDTLSKKKEWSASTVKTLLSRLVCKNILSTEKIGNKFFYNSIYTESDCLENLTQTFLKKFCTKKTKLITNYIIEENNLSKSDIDSIIKLLLEKRKVAEDRVSCNCIKGQCTCKK
ncbi:CopY/TcrY family copper transport repressor [Gemella cuniculi]|uniref:CopY/TcrY family copper transport repressor n=1 Tax=Gemella cuniculi TaxID=150240 RepID=UPI000405DAB2|nr:CopY/TcrY family copper transport repressor [Gemella cuniculi]